MMTKFPPQQPHDEADGKADVRTVWLLSPYHSGSHRVWARGYQRHSRHRVDLLTMAGRFWKWRMQGGAIEMAHQAARRLAGGERPDFILATDMLNLPAWLGLLHGRVPPATPIGLYMHENQLTYPWRPGEKPDNTYAMINWLSQLSAACILFNSGYHLESWFDAAPRLLKHFPDYNHLGLLDEVRAKSRVLPVGIHAAAIGTPDPAPDKAPPLLNKSVTGVGHAANAAIAAAHGDAPLILWNQRWEYDKRPDRFFALLYRLDASGVPFRLAVAGENFRNVPAEFEAARMRLAEHIVHWGYVDTRADYIALLRQADLVISTAAHEFFGISILEAIAAGAFPLLPNRLSYPELIPPALHPACLYTDEAELFSLARTRLSQRRPAPPSLRTHVVEHYDWGPVAHRYDAVVDELCARRAR